MTFRLRAVRALVLLAGFYLLGLFLLAAMATVDWLVVTRLSVSVAIWPVTTALMGTVLAAVAILRGMFAFLRAGRLGPASHAAAVTPEEQPELWDQVRAAAEATGERPPDELYLIAEVNAGVSEQGRLLGLLPGRRRMLLGLPLLAGLNVPQLRAVLAHEFGHYSNRDTRLGGVTMRGRAAVMHTVEAFGGVGTRLSHLIGSLYVRYARMFLRTSQPVARQQELAADQVAARYAGRDAMAAALRALPLLDAAHTYYLETYAGMGKPVGALPPVGEVHAGFPRLLAARTSERLAALSAGQRSRRPHDYDSHPPTAERVALIEELPEDGRPDGSADGTAAPALVLLRDPERVFVRKPGIHPCEPENPQVRATSGSRAGGRRRGGGWRSRATRGASGRSRRRRGGRGGRGPWTR
jgi:Zn-dependent protease with chaperone function